MAAVVASTPLMGTTSRTTGRSCRSLPLLPAAADDGEKEVGREGRTRAKPTRSSNTSLITSGERDFLVLVVGFMACFEFHICALQKKDTFVTFWVERFFLSYAYDTSMTIIVTKPGIIIDVVGSYFYDKKS